MAEHPSLPAQVVSALREHHLTLSCAESCTGGLIAKEITDVPGASAVFHGGVVSYVNEVKRDVLGVKEGDLETLGPVSEAVARQMAEGARARLKTDLAVSTTGAAGPGADERGNEAGTVFIALAADGSTVCHACHFPGARDEVRHAAASYALQLVLDHCTGENGQP